MTSSPRMSWKSRNYSYYLWQKRVLSSRPEYKKHRRDIYRQRRMDLLSQHGYTAPPRGRPKKYTEQEALSRKRTSARVWARLHREKKISTIQNDQHECETEYQSD